MAEKVLLSENKVEDFEICEATKEQAGSIQAIDKGSVHRICSGQVVLTLAIAVKELVENSVDAKATSIEVKLKEHGSEAIEVSDNGTGVEEKNFAGLTLKHHTSKIQDFSDVVGVETFGFRGEALSSLCALCNLSVVTRHEKADVGTKLEFDYHGRITGKAPCPRQKGTTVLLQNLFSTLPVRHREFQRNLKKEFAKMVQVLNAYCLVTTGVRISCTNQVGKGSRSTVLSTKGNVTLRENIGNIFGPKQLQSLLEFKQQDPTEEVCSWYNVKPHINTQDLFRIEGFISKCEHGQGRSSTDRQFIYINNRPCDSAKVMKLINEVYHSYNRHQYPFVVLNINMEKESVDVNVTPDKRQIFLQGEKLLLATLKTSLVKVFEPTTSILKINSFLTVSRRVSDDNSDTSSERSLQLVPDVEKKEKPSLTNALSKLKRSFSSAFTRDDGTAQADNTDQSKQRKLDTWALQKSQSLPTKFDPEKSVSISEFLPKDATSQESDVIDADESEPAAILPESQSVVCSNFSSPRVQNISQVDSFLSSFKHKCSKELGKEVGNSDREKDELCRSPKREFGKQGTESCQFESVSSDQCDSHVVPHSAVEVVDVDDDLVSGSSRRDRPSDSTETGADELCRETLTGRHLKEDQIDTRSGSRDLDVGDVLPHENSPQQRSSQAEVTVLEYDEKEDVKRKERKVPFSFSVLKARKLAEKKKRQEDDLSGEFSRTFRANITPGDNHSAEEELQREIKKDMFSKMEVLGQFNLGFILTRLGEDLFIVDQHATDEKYNFEMLQQHTVIQSQKLIHPQSLELTASNETILIDNLDVFKKNGFDFVIDETALPTQRVKLASTPVSKNWNFGKDDIEELIFMLTDSPGVMCRPSRVRMMFASRACRKAIMIGTALNKGEMRKLLCHMGEIDQPWNCPHGRPTMRHLFNLNMLPK